MEKIIKTAMGVGNTAMGMENTGTYPIRDTERLASAINNLANAIDRLNEQPEETDPTKGCDCDFCRGYRWSHEKEKDTPEQTEEWEKKSNKDGTESKRSWYKRWCYYASKMPNLTAGVEDGVSFDEHTKECLDELEQLLEEREKEVIGELLREIEKMPLCEDDGYSSNDSDIDFIRGQSHFKGHIVSKLKGNE